MASADIVVNVLTKLQDSGVKQAESKFGKFGSTMKKAMVPAVAATAAVVGFGVAAVNSASRLEQAMGGVDAVFGKNAGTVKKWAGDAAGSIGLAKSEYGELATLIGSQLKNAGIPMDQVTKKTGDLITKGADLAAMYGGTTAEAVEALSSALKGEFDPMDKYGGSLSAAKIAAEQAAGATDKYAGKTADQAKALATLDLITKQTKDSQGAAAREQDTVAAKTQQATAQYENMKATLGQALLPVVSQLMGYLADLATWLSNNTTVVYILVGAILALAAAVVVINLAMLVMAANPVVLTIAAIVAGVILLAAAFMYAWKKSETFQAIVKAVFAAVVSAGKAVGSALKAMWDFILNAGKAVFNWIKKNWAYLLAGLLMGPFGIAVVAIVKNWDKIKAAGVAVWNWLKNVFSKVWNSIRAAAIAPFTAIATKIKSLKGAAETVWNYLTNAFSNVWGRVKDAATRALSPIESAVDSVASAFDSVVSAIQDVIHWLGNIKMPNLKLPSALSKIGGLVTMTYTPPTPAPSAATLSTPSVARGGRAVSSSGGSVININVTGAVDPENTARQIRRVLDGHGVRMGTP